ncbi:hypothetical protein B0H11DRAFT_1878516 [Mycena galericulata]|nr:hypothetical protein B0H11DRAFT_1878516 [Mycena galericulata]
MSTARRTHASSSFTLPPMFASSCGFQIIGGNFYDVAGSVNIRSIQAPGLKIGSAQDVVDRRPVGVERTQERRGGVRILPYDISQRQHISSRSGSSSEGTPILFDYPHLQSGNELQFPPIDPLRVWDEHESSDTPSRPHDLRPDRRPHPDVGQTSTGSESRDSLPPISALDSFLPNSGPSRQSSGDAFNSRHLLTDHYHVHPADFEQGRSQPDHIPADPPLRSLPMTNTSFPFERPLHEPKTSINGGTFIGGNVNNIQHHGETGLHILHRAIAGDAFHDSADRYPQPQCHPDTRRKMLDVLQRWARGTEPQKNWMSEDDEFYYPPKDADSDSNEDDGIVDLSGGDHSDEDKPSSGILWLHGPAGSGKSAIAQSLCEKLQGEGRLGGSFFFKRGHPSRGNASKLFPTIAYELARVNPELKNTIAETVENDPAIVHRSFSAQIQNLIIEPCRRTPLTHPVCVVIDGLDECNGQEIQQAILRSISTTMQQEPLPVLFFIASRPEPHITEVFNEPDLNRFHRALNIRQSFEDVRRYLRSEFSRIHREHRSTMSTVSLPWPSPELVETLVEKSSGYFIYASTIIKYIDDKNFRPTTRLEIILGIKPCGLGSPFDTLDQLYIRILSDLPLDSRPQLLRIFTVIAAKFTLTVSDIEKLLDLDPGDVGLILRNLHSVIKVENTDLVVAHHASFLDFLHDATRSGPFCIADSQHTDLVRYILKALAYRGDHLLNGAVARSLNSDCFLYIPKAQPSPDFVPVLRSMNPDFFFSHDGMKLGCYQNFFNWLKNFPTLGDDFIALWDDYRFMRLCERVWDGFPAEPTLEQNHHNILSHVSPQLIRLLRALRAFLGARSHGLWCLHLFLDLSWDELRSTICPLRALVGEDKQRLQEVFAFATDPILVAEPSFDATIRDLAWGALRLIKIILNDEMPINHRSVTIGWGFFLRFCGPVLDYLRALEEIETAWASSKTPIYENIFYISDLHSVVQWLKTFPQPPRRLIVRFEQLLGPSSAFDDLEKQWMKWQNRNRELGRTFV